MKIRTQLIGSVAIFAAILVACAIAVIVGNQRLQQINAQEDISRSLQQDTNELGFLTNSYLLFHDQSQLILWQSQMDSISSELEALKASNQQQQNLINDMKSNQQRTLAVFAEIKASMGNNPGANASLDYIGTAYSRLAVQNQGIIANANQLSLLLGNQSDQIKQTNSQLIFGLFVVFGLLIITNFVLINRRVIRGLSSLETGAKVIGSGNLNHVVPVRGKDEIGEVSSAFNQMTSDLKTVTASKTELEKEIDERKKAEKTLRESEEKFSKAFHGSPVAMTLARFDTSRWVDVNDAYAGLVGYSREDLLTHASQELKIIDPAELKRLADMARTRGGLHGEEVVIRRKDGEPRTVLYYSESVVLNDVDHSIFSIVDITERKKAEEALKESEQRFRAVAEASPVMLSVSSADGTMLFTNPAYDRAFGYADGEVAGRQPATIMYVNPADRAAIIKAISEKGSVRNYELQVKRADGSAFWVSSSAQAIVYTGKPAFLAALLDITERKEAEEALKESEERYRSLFETMIEGVAHCKMLYQDGVPVDWVYLDVNSAFERITGLKGAAGKNIFSLIPDVKETNPELFEIYGRVAGGGPPEHVETYVPGLGIWLSITVHSPQKEHFVAVFSDVTERKKMEEALRESEEKFRAFAENTDIQIIMSTLPEGKVLYVNPSFEAKYLYTGVELVGSRTPDLYYDLEERKQVVHELQTKGFLNSFEMKGKRKDGTWFWNSLTARVIKLGGQSVAITAALDITERKKAEEALRDSEERFRALSETSPIGVGVSSAEGVLLYANPSYELMLGYDHNELSGTKAISLYWNPEDRLSWINTLKEKGLARDCEVRLKRKDGNPVWVSISVSSFVYQGMPAVMGTIQDISERKRAEENLRQTRDYLENLINYANAPIIVWAPDNEITRFNHAFEHLTGHKADGVIGKRLDILFPKDSCEASLELIRKTSVGERWESVEIPILNASGEVRTVLWNSATLYAVDGRTPFATIAQGQDITERKEAEADLMQRTAELEAANKELEAFSYSVSHDLREPLRAIDGFSRMLSEDYKDKLDAGGQRMLDTIRNGTDRMAQLISDLLAFSRLSRQEMKSYEIDMRKLAETISAELKASNTGRNLDIRVGALPSAQGDPTLIQQVLVNLISNAIKFTRPKDHATIEIGSSTGATENVYYVKDNGVGFDPQYASKLFGIFQRLHSRDQFEGTGVGLAIVQRIVHRHGGRVWAESKLGEGATFYFALPGKGDDNGEHR